MTQMTQMNEKRTIIFLHGTLGTAKDLSPLMQLLEEKGYFVAAFNFPGHGNPQGGQWPEEFRIDLFAREFDQFMKVKNYSRPIVFGHSIGGYVALYHKANFEDSPISQIITYGTKFNWSEKSVAKELPMLDPQHLQEKFPQNAEMLMEKHGERWKSLLFSTAHMMQHLEKLDGLSKEDLSEIDIPVTFILGDQDRVVSTEETLLTSNKMRKCQVKTLTHSKHELERSNLRELSEIIREAIE
jgi:esterase/lipase